LNSYDIPHKKVGKWIFASQSEQLSYLQELKKKGDTLGIPLRFLTKKEITEGEPNLKVRVTKTHPLVVTLPLY
jgi:L-2-hydroxyglutarate oxidase LhgO